MLLVIKDLWEEYIILMLKINKLKQVLRERLKEHVTLRDFTTMKVGGVADYFFEAQNTEDLISAIIAARADKIPFFIMGWGSNILISDYGYPGLVIKNKSRNISVLPDKAQVIADSGADLSKLILYAINRGLGGMEKLYGIPGSVGGAVYGNAGAYQIEIIDFIRSVTMLSPENKIVSKSAGWLEVKYRSTRLKRNKEKKYIILTVKFQLAHNKKKQMLMNIAEVKTKRDKRIGGLGPSCGSIFRNPASGKSYANTRLAKKKSAGYFLEQIGAKKMRVGDAAIFAKHANIIENKGKAKAVEVRELIENLREEVRKESGTELKEEIEYIGQWE